MAAHSRAGEQLAPLTPRLVAARPPRQYAGEDSGCPTPEAIRAMARAVAGGTVLEAAPASRAATPGGARSGAGCRLVVTPRQAWEAACERLHGDAVRRKAQLAVPPEDPPTRLHPPRRYPAEEFFERQFAEAARLRTRAAKREEDRAGEEVLELSGPEICKGSRRLAQDLRPLQERAGTIIQLRLQELARMRQELREQELEQLTVAPSSARRRTGGCCRRGDTRSWDAWDASSWGGRRRRQRERQASVEAEKLQECTFQPHVRTTGRPRSAGALTRAALATAAAAAAQRLHADAMRRSADTRRFCEVVSQQRCHKPGAVIASSLGSAGQGRASSQGSKPISFEDFVQGAVLVPQLAGWLPEGSHESRANNLARAPRPFSLSWCGATAAQPGREFLQQDTARAPRTQSCDRSRASATQARRRTPRQWSAGLGAHRQNMYVIEQSPQVQDLLKHVPALQAW